MMPVMINHNVAYAGLLVFPCVTFRDPDIRKDETKMQIDGERMVAVPLMYVLELNDISDIELKKEGVPETEVVIRLSENPLQNGTQILLTNGKVMYSKIPFNEFISKLYPIRIGELQVQEKPVVVHSV